MVRIVNTERPLDMESLQAERTQALLQLLAILIADKPAQLIQLLEDYSVPVTDKGDTALSAQVITAISECNAEFNEDLAKLLFNCSQESNYDNFDIKSLFKKKDQQENSESTGSQGGNGGGIWTRIANVVGSLGGTVGKVIQGRQAKDQVTAQTLQNIYNYKAQLAATEQNKTKSKNTALILLFIALGIILLIMAYKNKQKFQQPLIS